MASYNRGRGVFRPRFIPPPRPQFIPTAAAAAPQQVDPDAIALTLGVPAPTVILNTIPVTDAFNRSNSTTTLGVADTGQIWQPLVGTWGISSNEAYSATATALSVAVVESTLADFDYSLECTPAGGTAADMGMVFRAIDGDDFLAAILGESGGVRIELWKADAGAFSLLATSSLTPDWRSAPHTLRVTAVAGAITVYLDAVSYLSHTLSGGDQTKYGSATKHGLWSNADGTSRFDDLNIGTGAVAQSVTPGAIALTLGTPAPQVNQASVPGAIALTLGTPAPSITQKVTPGAVALTLGTPAPTVTQVSVPGAIALTLGTPAPSITQRVVPGAIALTLGTPAPSITVQAVPGAIALALGIPAPAVTQQVTPGAIALTLTPVAPTVERTGDIPQTGLVYHYDFSDVSTLFEDTSRTDPVDVDGDFIKGVTDLSGDGNHLSEATNPPVYKTGIINGLSVVRFAGNLTVLNASSVADATNRTIFVLCTATTPTNNNYFIDHGAPTGNAQIVAAFEQAGDEVVRAYAGTILDRIVPDGTMTTPHVITAVYNGASSKVGLDDAYTTGNTGSGHAGGLTVGQYAGGANIADIAGDIAEIIGYDRVLDDAEIDQVWTYLEDKWLSAGQTVSPDAIALTLGTPAPVVAQTNLSPGAIALTLGTPAPSITLGAAPGAITLTLGTPAPSITQKVTLGAIALSLGNPAPLVSQPTAGQVDGVAIALTLGIPAPTVTQASVPGAIALTLGTPAPSVTQSVTPGSVSLALGLPAPTITITVAGQVDPPALALLLSVLEPTISVFVQPPGAGDYPPHIDPPASRRPVPRRRVLFTRPVERIK